MNAPASSAALRAGFDYSALDVDKVDFLRRAVEYVRARHVSVVKSIINAGEVLLAVKEHLDHGLFLAWLRSELGLTARTAERYMRAAEAFRGKSDTVSHLPVATLYALAAPSFPAEERADLVRRYEAGEAVPAKEIRDKLWEARQSARASALQARSSARRRRRREEVGAQEARDLRNEREAEEVSRRAGEVVDRLGVEGAKMVVELFEGGNWYLVVEEIQRLLLSEHAR